jgi:flavin-dependent dehydrogenase
MYSDGVKEVKVIGAGLAGLTYANHLSSINPSIYVTVLEKDRRFGQKPCGEGTSMRTLNEFSSITNVDDCIRRKLDGFIMELGEIEQKFREPAAIINKEKLCERLAEKARTRGVDVRTGQEVQNVNLGKDGLWKMSVLDRNEKEHYDLYSQLVVVANGVNPRFSIQTGISTPEEETEYFKRCLLGLQVEARAEDIDKNYMHFSFDRYCFYRWKFPESEEGDAKIGMGFYMPEKNTRSNTEFQDEVFGKFLEDSRVKGDPESIRHDTRKALIPMGGLHKCYADHKTAGALALGDRSGEVCVLSAAGIRGNALCGKLAAEVTASLGKGGKLEDYEEARKELPFFSPIFSKFRSIAEKIKNEESLGPLDLIRKLGVRDAMAYLRHIGFVSKEGF